MLRLHSYWRSSAAYRVRIALNLKVLDYELAPVHLVRNGGEQHSPAYRALNPQGLVPLLEDDGFRLPQSLAILQYLEARWPDPALTPEDLRDRARMWAFCQTIACEIHPLNNLRVLQQLEQRFSADAAAREDWYRHWMAVTFPVLEQMLEDGPHGTYCFGDRPSVADCCLIPQCYNAQRYQYSLSAFPRITAIAAHCAAHPAFQKAHPDRQPDAPPAPG